MKDGSGWNPSVRTMKWGWLEVAIKVEFELKKGKMEMGLKVEG